MLRILASSDWHLDASTAGVPREREFGAYYETLHRYIMDRHGTDEAIDLVLLPGDFANPGTMQSHYITGLLFECLDRLRRVCPTVVISGNHDVLESTGAPSILYPMAKIFNRADRDSSCFICEFPEVLHFDVGDFHTSKDLFVVALPFVSKTFEDSDLLRSVLDEAIETREKNPEETFVVVSHATSITGAVEGSESSEMARGRPMSLPMEKIRRIRPDVVVNGHYHMPQTVKGTDGNPDIIIPGSWARLTFGEDRGPDRGFIVIEV